MERVNFHGQPYLKVDVTYDKGGGGSETWEFFFDPNTFSLKAYQFYGSNQPNYGEYVLLDGEVKVDDVIMPKKKTWYHRIDSAYAGTDKILTEL